jgi:site-specific DNA-methyltransferase (cytosine-N4-specific)
LRDYGVDGQIGLEPTLEEYHARMLEVTAECMRVLKPTGVMFWVHGDSYNGSKIGSTHAKFSDHVKESQYGLVKVPEKSIPIKSMVMQNERLIIKMIDEQGWILRNRIIWSKPNGMPSSVTDRFSNKYEPVYMLTKNQRYWFDLDVVRVPLISPPHSPGNKNKVAMTHHFDEPDRVWGDNPLGKNPGDVWTIPTQP